MISKTFEERMCIQQELLIEAQHMIDNKKNVPLVYESKDKDLQCRQAWVDDSNMMSICEVIAAEIMPE